MRKGGTFRGEGISGGLDSLTLGLVLSRWSHGIGFRADALLPRRYMYSGGRLVIKTSRLMG